MKTIMKNNLQKAKYVTLAFAVVLLAFVPSDKPDIDEAEALVDKMVEAHGGMNAFNNANMVSFKHILYMPGMSANFPRWMVSEEIIDQKSNRKYANYPMWESKIINDGEKVWSVNWTFGNPAAQMSGIHYNFAFLPWLANNGESKFGTTGKSTLPDGGDTNFNTIEFTNPKLGPATWTLFIHPETNLLGGFKIDFPGPGPSPYHTIKGYNTFGGLTFATDWMTRAVQGEQSRIIGYHALINVELNPKVDKSVFEAPSGAKLES